MEDDVQEVQNIEPVVRVHGNKGKPKSEETKAKMRSARLGKSFPRKKDVIEAV